MKDAESAMELLFFFVTSVKIVTSRTLGGGFVAMFTPGKKSVLKVFNFTFECSFSTEGLP